MIEDNILRVDINPFTIVRVEFFYKMGTKMKIKMCHNGQVNPTKNSLKAPKLAKIERIVHKPDLPQI